MSNKDNKQILSELFSLHQETSVKRPALPWNRADAKNQAGMEAYNLMSKNKNTLRDMGYEKPAAALFVNNDARYAYTIYEKGTQKPEDVVPEKTKVILTIDPFYL